MFSSASLFPRHAAPTHAPAPMAHAQPYGTCVLQSATEARGRDAPPPRVCVACIGPAGAGACFFHGWGAALPDWLEVLPVELPGRNTRLREAMPARGPSRGGGPR